MAQFRLRAPASRDTYLAPTEQAGQLFDQWFLAQITDVGAAQANGIVPYGWQEVQRNSDGTYTPVLYGKSGTPDGNMGYEWNNNPTPVGAIVPMLPGEGTEFYFAYWSLGSGTTSPSTPVTIIPGTWSAPLVSGIAPTVAGATTYSFTATATTPLGTVTMPAQLASTTTGPNSPPTTANPINVSVTTTTPLNQPFTITLYQTTPTPGPVATITYNPLTQGATATTPAGALIAGVTVSGGKITVPITGAPTQSQPLPSGIGTTAQLIAGGATAYGLTVQPLPQLPAPTLASSTAGSQTVNYSAVLQTPQGTYTLPSSALSVTSVTTPASGTPIVVNVDLTGLPPGSAGTVILYRQATNTTGLPNGPITVAVTTPGQISVSLTDTGQGLLPGVPLTVTANTTGTAALTTVVGSVNVAPLSTPTGLSVTPLTSGITTQTYKLVAVDSLGNTTAASTAATTTTAAATPDNFLSWTPVVGAYEYQLYRTAGGSTQGLIATVNGSTYSYVDNNATGNGATPPSSNTTGQLLVNGTTVGGSGTVTSVDLSMPSQFGVTGNPVTSSGTLAVAWDTQSANTILAGPTSGGAAAPTFRALVPADYPVFVASGASHAAGAVPDPGSGAGTTKFLREDATWQVPSGGSGMTNPMTTLGDLIYEDATPAPARLAGNTTTTKNFLQQTGTGTGSAPPAWGTISAKDPIGSGAHVKNSANLTIASGAASALTFDTNTYDSDSYHSTVSSTSRLVAPVNGYYALGGSVSYSPTGNAGNISISIRINGTTTLAPVEYPILATGVAGSSQSTGTVYKMAAGDYAEVMVAQTTGVNQTANAVEGWIQCLGRY